LGSRPIDCIRGRKGEFAIAAAMPVMPNSPTPMGAHGRARIGDISPDHVDFRSVSDDRAEALVMEEDRVLEQSCATLSCACGHGWRVAFPACIQ